jgi:hypothetical protein
MSTVVLDLRVQSTAEGVHLMTMYRDFYIRMIFASDGPGMLPFWNKIIDASQPQPLNSVFANRCVGRHHMKPCSHDQVNTGPSDPIIH